MLSSLKALLQDFAKAGANMFTFHLEAVVDVGQLSQHEAHPAVVDMAHAVCGQEGLWPAQVHIEAV